MQAEHIIIASLVTGLVAFWGGFLLRKTGEQPSYSRVEIDSMQLGLRDRLDATDERLERIETKVDQLLQNGRRHAG